MKYLLVSCEVFLREVCYEASQSPYTIDLLFNRLRAHENPKKLRETIQKAINEAEGKGYDAILLGYGLCGNAVVGLVARSVPLIIPRAHDCCTIFLGSRERFLEHFGNDLSAQWSCTGYMERDDAYLRDTDTGMLLGLDRTYEEYVEQYGEENAKYIWETLHPKLEPKEYIFIEMPATPTFDFLEKLKARAAEQGKEVRVLKGDNRILRSLVRGDWNEKDFLMVRPGNSIVGVYDQEQVVAANAD